MRTWIDRRGTVVGSLSQNIGGRTEGRVGWDRSAIAGAFSFVTSVRFMSLLPSSAYHSSAVAKDFATIGCTSVYYHEQKLA